MDVNEHQHMTPPPVAIISMGCFFPHASGLKAYWHLLYHGKDAISDVPPTHWSPEDYFSEDIRKPDHVYCRRGGFLSPIPFDPTAFGIPPSNLEATDSSQILALIAAKTALDQAGYGEGADFDRDQTAVILGVTGTQELVIPLSSRLSWPKWKRALESAGVEAEKTRAITRELSQAYVAWQENSFPGLLGNVVAGRICNRLDLGGTNCVVDAACASSMSAINLALMELYTGRSRMVVTGGVDTLNDIFMHMCFARTQILSPSGDARPFSAHADGTVLGEGIGILIMKRLADAEADGDRILAVMKGIGSSSDGKSQSIYAPRVAGQLKALQKAYAAAGIAPATIDLIEAHGTGTRVGDKIEVQALRKLFGDDDETSHCALGSVKSMIGHTKAAAGAAGLIKTVIALQHKILPPTLKADQPDPDLALEKSPFYLNARTRPWFRTNGRPRRAGVSAFGFGGSNFHVVLEEHSARRADVAWDGSIEIVALSEPSRDQLLEAFESMRKALGEAPPEAVPHLARQSRASFSCAKDLRLLLTLTRTEDHQGPRWDTDAVFDQAARSLETNAEAAFWQTPAVIFGSGKPPGRLAFMFPGQGSQYLHMGRDLVNWFPEALETLESASDAFSGQAPLTDYIYPRPLPTQSRQQNDDALRHTAVAQPAIGGVSVAMDKVLKRFGLAPDATCGHSYGELTALFSAGWFDESTLHALSALRGRLMAEAGGNPDQPNGAMLAVKAPLESLERLLAEAALDVVLANRNAPRQGILSGSTENIRRAEEVCKAHKLRSVRLPVSAAFHSPLVESARKPFAAALQSIPLQPGSIPVYSNTTGAPYPTAPEAIRALLGDHLRNPVNFIGEIEALYEDGHRIFLEVGPKTVLTGLVRTILKGRDFHALAMDASNGKKFGIADLAHLLCQAAALGCPVVWDEWEHQEDPPPGYKMRIPITGANYRTLTPEIEKHRSPGGVSSQPEPSPASHAESLGHAPDEIRPRTSDPTTGGQATSEHPTPAGFAPGPQPTTASSSVNNSNHPIWQALQVVQQGLQSLQALHSQTVAAHHKFLDTQQQASRTLQEMMENARHFGEAALNGPTLLPTPALASGAEPAAPAATPEQPTSAEITSPGQRFPDQNAPDVHNRPGSDTPIIPPADAGHQGTQTVDRAQVVQVLLEAVSELTGYPADMLAMDMHIESDLGIDSIKRVEILSRIEEKMPALPTLTPDVIAEFETLGHVAAFLAGMPSGQPADPVAKQPASTADNAIGATETGTAAVLLEVVSALTGYPLDMLHLEMDVASDLGIDSIKRVEILSALEERMPDLPSIAPEEMAGLQTLAQIARQLSASADAPDPASPAPSDAPAAPGGQASPEIVLDALLAVVSDLTGYPTEMLSPDMDIEADLGIDSIKRVEILSAMEDRLPQLTLIAPDEMADLKKLGQIATTLAKGYPAGAQDQTVTAAPVAEPSPPPSPTTKPTETRPLIRRKLVTMETPRRSAPPLIVPEQRKIFITTDKAGLSHALADQLAAMGLPTVQISVDILQHREQLPDAAGLILLCDREDGANGAPGAHSKPSLSDAFELIQHLGPSLQASAKEGGAVLATISRMDGTFGVDRWKSQHPYQGGMAGFAKTAAIEWPEVTCRALDIDAAWGDNPAMAKEIVAELFSPMPDGPVEVGWREQRRVTLGLTPAPLDDHSRRPLALDRGDVVVLSGGARGITAAAAQALAQEQSLTLILLGRSPQPFEEPEWLQGIEHEADLKKAIIGHDFAATPPTPQTVHEAYQRYIGNREIQQNLARLAAMGSEARYFSLDIREADKVRAVINDIRLVHGPVKALIHGAGVLRDRLISDKTAHEFDQVFSTKVIGMENLLAAAKDDPLRYIVIFSSVAARFGNIGQVDYAVANEVLNKMAAAEAHERRDCVVRSINWGPWDGGMVTDSLKNAFAARDIPLIPLDQGALAFVSELTADETDPVEVVIGSELPATAPSVKQPASKTAPEPAETSAGVGLSTAYISDLNLERYPILNHHRLDGKPVVPFALMAEWFGHGALHNHPGFQLTGLDDMRLLKGIVLEDRQRPIRILAGASQSNGEGIKVKLELRDGIVAGNEVIHARATAILADRLPSPPRFTIPADLRDATYDRDVAQIYSEILFHGEALQGLRRVRACTAGGMLAALVTAPSPSAWIQKPPRNRWIADPLILDGAFQMASLWCYEETGRVSLPSYSAAYRQYCRRFPSAAIEAVLTVQKVSRHKLIGDFTFLDKDGNVLATMTGFEAVMEDRLIRAFKPERFAAVR